ncbi:hypothetical protein M9Y10_016382 [Tritrichomonas musculus]|uniref:Protein kinase domain-containing protein n=1 Tax=Tritrichomonas musculus TaxID=1915356 RepID=A0ABR2HW10_9EUKA
MDDCCLTVPYNIIHIRPGELPIVYKRCEELGHGGFAKVFRAVNKNTGEEVAIKVTSREKLKKPKAEQKHKSEVAIQMSLHHPNIVKAYDFFTDQFFTYLVLELCPGGSLKSLVRQKKQLPEIETIKYLIDILNGLCYLHDNRIIHRDLKLDNFLIDKEGNVKIADFGLSTKLSYDDERKHSVCGTPNYISPELLLDAKKGISYEVDIWAVGVATYGMLTGVLPFQTKHTKDTYERIKRCSYSFPPNCDLTPGAKSFIQSVLQLDPEMRPTALELQYCHWIQSRKMQAKRLALNNNNSISTSVLPSTTLNSLKPRDALPFKRDELRSVSRSGSIKPLSQNQNSSFKSSNINNSSFKSSNLNSSIKQSTTNISTNRPVKINFASNLQNKKTAPKIPNPIISKQQAELDKIKQAIATTRLNNELLKQDLLGRSKNNENAESNISQKNTSKDTIKPPVSQNQNQVKQSSIATTKKTEIYYVFDSKKPLTENNNTGTRASSNQKDRSINEVQVTESEIKINNTGEDKSALRTQNPLTERNAINITKDNNKSIDINKSIEIQKVKDKKTSHHLKEKRELPEKIQMPKYMVSRFCDHNGLGYLLMNGCVGACFKDGTRMILDPHQTFIQYWETYQDPDPKILDPNGSIETKKISILKKFSSSLKKSSSMFEIPNEIFDRNEPMLHVKYWMRTKDVTLFRMNNRNIQLNFVDRRKLIIFWNIRKLMSVSTIYDYGELHKLHDVSKRPDGDDEKWRLEMAKQLLSIMSRGNA